MSSDVRAQLEEFGLMDDYRTRPAYQQDDYIGWIDRAKGLETREKRLNQMLDELKVGDGYMNMKWSGPRIGKR